MKRFLLTITAILLLTSNCLAYDGLSGRMASGRKVISTAGTRERLSANSNAIQKVIITAETDNTGVIVVGGDGVIASLSTREGIPLSAGQSITLLINDLNKVYLDTTVSGDGVTYLYFQN